MLQKNGTLDILVRYLLLVIVALPGLWLFYFVFTPLTVYPVTWLLDVFYGVSLVSGHIIIVNQEIPIELIAACIAGSAYYLLLILNFSTREIRLETRIKAITFSFLTFLIVNILRIFFLSIIAVSGSTELFDATHKIFWYGLSTIFVVAIWFFEVKKFKIKTIPFYSDIKWMLNRIRKR